MTPTSHLSLTACVPAVALLVGTVAGVSCNRAQHTLHSEQSGLPASAAGPGQKTAGAGTRTVVIHVGGMMKSKSGAT